MLHSPQLSEAGTELQWDINDLESTTQRKTFCNYLKYMYMYSATTAQDLNEKNHGKRRYGSTLLSSAQFSLSFRIHQCVRVWIQNNLNICNQSFRFDFFPPLVNIDGTSSFKVQNKSKDYSLPCIHVEQFSNESLWPITTMQITRWTNQNLKNKHVTGTKRGKMHLSKVTIGFGFAPDWLKKFVRAHCIRELAKQNQSKHNITFQTKTFLKSVEVQAIKC